MRLPILHFLFAIICYHSSNCYSQHEMDTIYLTANFSPCDSSFAKYYSTTETIGYDAGIVSIFHLNGTLKSKIQYSSLSKKTRNGLAQIYDEVGNIFYESTYLDGTKNGDFHHYFENGKLRIKGQYKADELNDSLITFYENGNFRRKDFYDNGKLTTGKCFSTMGKDTIYFDFNKDTEFPDGMNGFNLWLTSNIVYPEEAMEDNQQGRVYVSFVVNEDGSISDIQIERGVCQSLDSEVIRLMKTMPEWTPQELDGYKIKTQVRLPVNFTMN